MDSQTKQEKAQQALTGNLAGQVAIVTGAGQGIGRNIALRLGSEGAVVALADLNIEGCQETAREMAKVGGGKTLVLPTDVSQEDQVRRMVSQVREICGGVNILVNNSGIAGPTALVEDIALEDWEATMAVNLRGVFLCCKHTVPVLKSGGGGCIVNISSVSAKRPLPRRTPYTASKMALIGFTRTLAAEAGPWGIRVNAVCPGTVAGPRQDSILQALSESTGKSVAELAEAKTAASPLGVFVEPGQVAAMAAFLCSADGAAVTGQDINVSAGAVMY